MREQRRWVEVAPKHRQTSFTLVTWFDTMPAGSMRGIVLDTDDIEHTYQELVERGIICTSCASRAAVAAVF